jgi:hypothetical protein
VGRPHGLSKEDHLGVLLDKHGDIDVKQGVFWKLLRYGSVNFEQVGRGMRYREAVKPAYAIKAELLNRM